MKHTNIAKTLGWTSTEDITEGLFLQPEEAATIDTALGQVASAEATAAELVTANASIATHIATIATMTTQETTDQATIADLQAQVAKLEKKPSGTGSALKAAASAEVVEDKVSETGKPRFDSADHPANRFADSNKKYDSGIPAKN